MYLYFSVFNLITSGLFCIWSDFGNASCPRPLKLGPLTRVIIRGGGKVKLQLQPRAAATAARIATEARVVTAARVATATTGEEERRWIATAIYSV